MPIYYQCMTCREEIYLPDSKAGLLASCPRCRLKFLAPAPNMQMIPTGGAPAPAPTPAPSPFSTPGPTPGPTPAPRPAAPVPGPAQTPATATSRPNLGAGAGNVAGSGIRRPGAPVPPPQQQPGGQPAAPPRPAAAGNSRPPLGGPSPGLRPAAPPPGTAPRPQALPVAKPGTSTPPANPARPAQPAWGTKPAPAAAPAPARPAPGPAAAARPSAPPTYPRDAAKPPLYPLDDKGGKPAPSPASGKKEGGLFGLKSGELPSLFGSSEESIAMRPNELFAEAIPSMTDAEDDMDVPIDLDTRPSARRTEDESDDDMVPAADEGGGVAVPLETDEASDASDRMGMPRPSYEKGSSSTDEVAVGGDDLISMDEIFSGKQQSRPAETPAFGAGGVLPAPFLKPAEPAPEPEQALELAETAHDDAPAFASSPASAPAPSPVSSSPAPNSAAATGSGPVPFALIPIEGIPDARFDLPGGGVYLLGRDKDAQVKILSTSVSRRHARIDATGHDHVLIDLGSANGTQVNGQSVARQPLRDGDLIRMGKVILRYAGPGKG